MENGSRPQPSAIGAMIGKIAILGAAIALCCFAPLLFVLVGTGGAAALAGYLNYLALLPVLALFLVLATYAINQRQKSD